MKTQYHNSILSKPENLRYWQRTDTWSNLNAIELSHFNTLLPLKLEKNPASIEPSGRMKLIIEGGQSIKNWCWQNKPIIIREFNLGPARLSSSELGSKVASKKNLLNSFAFRISCTVWLLSNKTRRFQEGVRLVGAWFFRTLPSGLFFGIASEKLRRKKNFCATRRV